jgi:hypothetical protein
MMLLILIEMAMGFLFYPIALLQQINSILCPILQYLFFILHFICLVAAVIISLSSACNSGVKDGLKLLALFWLGLMCKDHIGAFTSFVVQYGGSYTVGDALILAAMETFANTVLAQGIAFLVQYFGLWFLILKNKKNEQISSKSPTPKGDALSLSTLVLVVVLAAFDLFAQGIDIIEFGESVFWDISIREYFTIVLGLIVTIVAACLAYVATGYLRAWIAAQLDKEQ